MELCHAYGLPHSQFTGAGDGRWTALDRAKAMAYLAYQRSVCETCGTRAAEWDESQGGDRFAYVAEPYRCVGCEVIEMEREHIPDGPDARGLKIGLRPREAS
ncbi:MULTISPECIES: hypothetical protein [Streptomyces]|jgi:NAD-dependent dihydropyrimidine dehydrogenase PreA subunit|uniref:NAD-dependent dihydropyrimidine dehydrogenase PreA subunit n=2 Tax=Streptomyces TaxID=1883 RepID=A0ABT6LEB8_9ACTN|nr:MULTISPECIES: hypothetical protein [Streptomyces]MDH6214129.1 NAD-dependent dihydropyrimidine dehydrogenase PreA subunit [Streptomyces pseudovenezuelae]